MTGRLAQTGIHRLMDRLGRFMAVAGGLVLLGLVIVTCVSVLGRLGNTLGHADWLEASVPALADLGKRLGPVRGDFEIVEAGVAFAIFAFLPWCQLTGGHATVDLLTGSLPRRWQRFLVALWEIVLAAVLCLLAWRLIVGALDKQANGETTFLLQFPVWWGFALCSLAAIIAAVVAVYVAAVRVLELMRDTDLLDAGGTESVS